ncbi:hypothetical protein LB941_06380 [Ligilactobacillus sp. WILCCON 0076]|uniref:Uncharacterized protein n=1 Tax=Ligilactobacillus ubinensis TaxID=2876789 RepID=A0A9X2FKM6_9LACO|nr:hypothetical protein [Ligilactobacillus ubinensis]MCP0886959.1 hypothetical protein [Ligilactobacillus ubinensis]
MEITILDDRLTKLIKAKSRYDTEKNIFREFTVEQLSTLGDIYSEFLFEDGNKIFAALEELE